MIVVAAGASAAYYLWDVQQKQAKLFNQQSQSLSLINEKILDLKNKSSGQAESITDNSSKLQNMVEQLQQTEIISQQAIEIVNRSQRDWALAEIDYLLRIAHQRIAVARDIGGAIAALKGADSRIEQLADLSLFKIRKQLAKDIANLNAIHQADVNGISLAIDQMIAYLPELPFKSVKDEIKVQFTENSVIEQPKSEDKTFVDSVLETVKEIGDIKVHQRSIKAASSAEQQNQIEQLLRTYLLSARLAALRFNQTQFLHEINQASEILRLHYSESDNRVEQLQKTLSDYSVLQLSPDLPELTKAWALLQKELSNDLEVEEQSVETMEVKK